MSVREMECWSVGSSFSFTLPKNYERCLANTLLYCSRSRYQECQKNPRAKGFFFFTGSSIIEECPKMFHEHTTCSAVPPALFLQVTNNVKSML